MLKSEVAEEKIRLAKILASLEDHSGWQIIRGKLETQIDNDRKALCSLGMPHDATEQLRYRVKMAEWLLASTGLDNADQVAKWEEDLAFQKKQEKMREARGLPPDSNEIRKLYRHEEEQG
jgi:hypothetical protein